MIPAPHLRKECDMFRFTSFLGLAGMACASGTTGARPHDL